MLLYGEKLKQWTFQKLLLSMISKLVDEVKKRTDNDVETWYAGSGTPVLPNSFK